MTWRVQRRIVVGLAGLALAALACSDNLMGPATISLQGRWNVGFTASESAFTCRFDSVYFLFGDSTAVPPGNLYGSARGSCVGRGRDDTALFLTGSNVDSLVMKSGRIRFVTHHGAFHYSGNLLSADSMAGAIVDDGYYTGVGAIHLTGHWGAARLPPGP